jgi:hypothetical protein
MSTTDKLLERKSSSSGLENRENGHRDLSRWPHGTLYLQKLALSLPTSGGCLVGIIRSQTQATEVFLRVHIIMQLIFTAVSVFHFLCWSQYSPCPQLTSTTSLTANCCCLFPGVNVKTGELFPATFPDKGPDQALRSARHLTGGQQVMFLSLFLLIALHTMRDRGALPLN